MFPTSSKDCHLFPKRAHRSLRRPQLEILEDRVVPSIADGTILVLDNPTTPTGPPTALVGVNPHTGAQTILSKGQLFTTPLDPREAPDGQIYVTDYQAYAPASPPTNVGGAVFRVDPETGHQRLVAKGGYINGASGLAVIHHKLYITDIGDDTGTYRNIVEITPETGKQRLVSKDGMLFNPLAIVPGPDDNLYVLDEHALANAAGTTAGALFEVNVSTGRQTLIATNVGMGGKLVFPIDMAQDPSGNLIIFNRDSATDFTVGAGSILRLNPHTGAITIVSDIHQGNLLSSLDGGAVARDGTIYAGTVTTTAPSFVPARILTVNPVTGAQHTLSEGKQMDAVEGLTVYYRPEEDDAPPDRPSAAAPLLKQAQVDSAEVVPVATLAPSLLATGPRQTQPVQPFRQALTPGAVREDTKAAPSAAVAHRFSGPRTALDSLFAEWGSGLAE